MLHQLKHMANSKSAGNGTVAYLEYFSARNKLVRRILLDPLPFRIGRGSGAHLLISHQEVSKNHSEIYCEGGNFFLRDLASTNGTFLNRRRIGQAMLNNDDLVHIAHEEFRFLTASSATAGVAEIAVTAMVHGEMPTSILQGSQYLQEMLAEQWGRILYQPIVDLDGGEVLGYEGLGRGMHTSLQVTPAHLFDLADQCGLAVPLSQMFLRMAVQETAQLPRGRHVFLNLHPSEIHCQTLPQTLREMLVDAPADRQFVLEINEKAVVDIPSLRRLREQFRDLGLKVAYDDFGAGQARFLELADLPPDFVKLDMGLIRDLHLNDSRQNLVKAITRASNDLGVQVIAEGIETQDEAATCRNLGCRFGQGFLFGRPQTAGLINPKKDKTSAIRLPNDSPLRKV
jgi:EAL domain-containing protein (putative c-di-GMP-specific phosphodiesterase class I)